MIKNLPFKSILEQFTKNTRESNIYFKISFAIIIETH